MPQQVRNKNITYWLKKLYFLKNSCFILLQLLANFIDTNITTVNKNQPNLNLDYALLDLVTYYTFLTLVLHLLNNCTEVVSQEVLLLHDTEQVELGVHVLLLCLVIPLPRRHNITGGQLKVKGTLQ